MLALHGVEYEIGSIRIHPLNRTVRREGQEVPLAPRAFDVLLLLIERQGAVVSKSELTGRLWPDTHVEESSLPVMISTIRRAIGDDGRKQRYIQTVSKHGYRLIGEIKEIHLQASAEPVVSAVPSSPPASRYSLLRFGVACAMAVFAALFLAGSTGPAASRSAAASERIDNPSTRSGGEMWYEKGRYAWNLQTRAGILQSIEYYRKAITANPGYALAWAGLAESYISLPSYSARTNDEASDRARAAATKAIALDNRLADAHIALGMVALIGDRNYAFGEHELRTAVELDPLSSFAHGELSLCLVSAGRTDEAVAHARRAKEIDPLSIRAATDLGIVLYYGHRFREARSEFEEVLKLDPYSYRTRINLGKTYLSLGLYDDALRLFEQASFLSDHDPLAEGLKAEAQALRGNREDAKSILASLERLDRAAYVAPISLAFAYSGLGRVDAALAKLKKAHQDHTIAALFLKVDPHWAALHRNPDFQNLVKDLPDPEQEETESAGK